MFDLIGYAAIIFSVLAFLTNTKNNMRKYGIISTILFGISIYAYQGFNGLFVTIISLITKLLSIKFNEEKLFFLKLLSPFLAVCFYFLFNKEGLSGLLPALSMIFIIFADLQEDIIKMKIIYYGSAFCWLFYGIVLGSIPAILFDIFGILALTYSIFKLKNKS